MQLSFANVTVFGRIRLVCIIRVAELIWVVHTEDIIDSLRYRNESTNPGPE